MLTLERTHPMGRHKFPSSYRLSEECRALIDQLSEALGISQAGVIEQAVRKLARAELPEAPAKPAPKPTKKKE